MNKDNLISILVDKQNQLEHKINEYKMSLSNAINIASNSTDFENISATSVRYATVIAKLQAEIQQLENIIHFVK